MTKNLKPIKSISFSTDSLRKKDRLLMLKSCLAAFLLLISPFAIEAQSFSDKKLCGQLAHYRSALLTRDSIQLMILKSMLNQHEFVEFEDIRHSAYIMTTFFSNMVKNNPRGIYHLADQYLFGDSKVFHFNAVHDAFVEDNIELLALIAEGVLEPDYPFRLKAPKLVDFLNFCKIEQEDSVVSIGPISPILDVMLAASKNNLSLTSYIKDKEDERILAEFIRRARVHMDMEEIKLIRNRKSKLKLSGDADQIMLKTHEYVQSMKPRFIRSLHSSLSEGGLLNVLVLKSSCNCHELSVPKDEILSFFEAYNFSFEEMMTTDAFIAFRFKRMPK